MTPAIVKTSQQGHESQEQLGFSPKIDFSQREAKALAALEGRYLQDPIIGMAPSVSHFPQGVMKPLNSSNINQAKLHQGGLNRGYSP
jgi:hypothetical protein